MFKKFLKIYRAYQQFLRGSLFWQNDNNKELKILVESEYIKPWTTKVMTMNDGVYEIKHYVFTRKKKIIKSLFNLFYRLRVF